MRVRMLPRLLPDTAMAKIKLTDRFINSCRCRKGERLEVSDAICPGLYLRVSGTGTKSFCLIVRHGTLIRKTLGRYPVLGLADARRLALEALRDLANVDRQEVTAKGKTVAELVDSYTKLHLQPNLRSWRNIRSKLLCAEAAGIKDRPAADVTKGDILAIMDRLVEDDKPFAAENLLKAYRALFNWAVARDEIATNPCIGLKSPAKHVQRDRILTDREISQVWNACDGVPKEFGALVRLLLLTGARRSEVAELTWGEIDGDVWRLPPHRSKSGRANARPLPPAAMAILSSLPRGTTEAFVLSTTDGKRPSSAFNKRKTLLDEASGVTGWTLHDLRRTVRSKLSELGIPWEVARRIVGHRVDSLDATYDRHDYLAEKREALGRLADHIVALAGAHKV